ncbi:MAG: ABC transporter ATP-binding protein [Flavobacteriales bacterium]|nr:ABC transporter ATP-binding protein [Flavobacteriales bacterium]MCX7649509.1 ABC transporter ATP-binding protein [Flavobacteriales bacterium]MDW8431786.1 ABC transporter ATP-binding protein [Flavobacteriales bacterium]
MEARTLLSFQDVQFSYLIPAGQATSFKEAVHEALRGRYFIKKPVLKGITFSLQQGERVGIVGRNGSGKTTLLRLACGIALPEHGLIRRLGTLAPVLSLGAGLEPELSGLENILLLYALAGGDPKMEKEVMHSVVEFSELSEQVLKMQVKRYSSGMMARLSFGVAMALNPDLLVVDEALAVGDAGFQQKCYAAIQEFCSMGGSLLLVSHAAEEVQRMCHRVLWLEEGELKADGPALAVLKQYQNALGL